MAKISKHNHVRLKSDHDPRKGSANPAKHPAKRSNIPADLLALGNYGKTLYEDTILPTHARLSQ